MEGGGEVSDTPITDSHAFPLPVPEGEVSQGFVASSVVRTLERENAAMREAIREAASAFKMLSDAKPETFAEQLSVVTVCYVEFSKLQPFLKP